VCAMFPTYQIHKIQWIPCYPACMENQVCQLHEFISCLRKPLTDIQSKLSCYSSCGSLPKHHSETSISRFLILYFLLIYKLLCGPSQRPIMMMMLSFNSFQVPTISCFSLNMHSFC
jgi:hypothetical protein